MSVLRNVIADFGRRWKMIRDQEASGEQRVFAALELFCFPVSLLTIFVVLPLRLILVKMGYSIPGSIQQTINVLLSAAVGYITNYIAIEMLFKPYIKTKTHPLSLVTLGYWQQGLIPKNKNKIGEELGRQIETKLLDPARLADELCGMVTGFIQDPQVIENLRNAIQNLLHTHEQSIIDFLIPQIEKSLSEVLDKVLTRERINEFWASDIEPFLAKEETRAAISSRIIASLQRRAPELTKMIRNELKQISYDYLKDKLPLGFGADTLSSGLVLVIDWNTIEGRLKQKFNDPATHTMLLDELGSMVDQLNSWLKSPETNKKVEAFIESAKTKLRGYLHNYLQTGLPAMTNEIIDSEKLWTWIEKDLLPAAKPKLEALIREHGKDKVIKKLNLATRVSDSVAKQDVKEFHEMINSIAAQHLGAIQVLGYILGLLIGLTQLFM